MIRWIKRGGAVWSGILLVALLYKHPGLAAAGGILNLVWVLDEKLPPVLCRLVGPSVLGINTVLSAYAVLAGAPAILTVLVAATSLLTWNTGLFLQRWGDTPSTVQRHYLKHLAGIVATGLGAGLSALALQGRLSLRFFPALLLMLIAGFLLLRVISQGSKKRN
jgi:hypothetical protein